MLTKLGVYKYTLGKRIDEIIFQPFKEKGPVDALVGYGAMVRYR